MILLDTNILSEVMKPAPNAQVIGWLNRQDSAQLYLCCITIGEVEYGLRALPDGQRRRRLQDRFSDFITSAFALRVLDYDEPSARAYGAIMAARRALGRPMGIADGQIAAIAKTHGFALATRNLRDFEQCGLVLIDPFVAAG